MAFNVGWLAAGLAKIISQSWDPTGDYAVIEAHTRDVGGQFTPLVGVYSRLGFDHPGPLLFWVLAIPYRLLGSDPKGLLVGALVVNFAAATYVVFNTFRHSKSLGLLAGVGLNLLVIQTASDDAIYSPWNPWMGLFPMAAFTIACWQTANGKSRALFVAIATGSWCVQAHLSNAAPVAAMLAGALVIGVRNLRRSGSSAASVATTGVLGLAAGLLLWMGPLIDQATGRGNLANVLSSASGSGQTVGPVQSLGLMARALLPTSILGPRDGPFQGGYLASVSPLWLIVPLAVGVGAVWIARARAHDSLLNLTLLCLFGIPAAYVTTARLDYPLYYLALSLRVLTMLLYVSGAWALWLLLSDRVAARQRWIDRAAFAVASLVGAVTVIVAVTATYASSAPEATMSRAVTDVTTQLRGVLDPSRPVIVETPGLSALTVGGAVSVDLERHGFEAFGPVVPHAIDEGSVLGQHRTSSDPNARVLQVIFGADAIGATTNNPSFAVIARSTTAGLLTERESDEYALLRQVVPDKALDAARAIPNLAARLTSSGPVPGVSIVTWEQVNRLIQLRDRAAGLLVVERLHPSRG